MVYANVTGRISGQMSSQLRLQLECLLQLWSNSHNTKHFNIFGALWEKQELERNVCFVKKLGQCPCLVWSFWHLSMFSFIQVYSWWLKVEREKELIDLSNNQRVILSGLSESTLYQEPNQLQIFSPDNDTQSTGGSNIQCANVSLSDDEQLLDKILSVRVPCGCHIRSSVSGYQWECPWVLLCFPSTDTSH